MIYLEKKVAIFENMVYTKKENEAKEKIAKEEERLKGLLEEKKAEIVAKEENLMERRRALAKKQGMTKLTSLKEKERLEILAKEQTLFQDLLRAIKNRFKDFQKTESYIRLEENKLEEILKNDHGDFILFVLDEEKESLGKALLNLGESLGHKLEIASLEGKYLGGFILEKKDRTYLYNRSLEREIEDRHYHFGAMLHKELKGQGEAE